MKAGLLSQRRTSSTKKMLRCHLCLLPTRIITIFLHMEGMVASFEGVKKNAISTKYREASSGGAQLQSSGRILGSCHSLSYLGCASFLTTFTGFSIQKCLHSQKKTPPPLTHLFKVQRGRLRGAGRWDRRGELCSSELPNSAQETPEATEPPRMPQAREEAVESILFLPSPGSTAAELSISRPRVLCGWVIHPLTQQ